MTPVVQLRKDPREVNVAEETPTPRTWQIPSTHINPFVQKILGLKTNS
jgi:hypothetical protein